MKMTAKQLKISAANIKKNCVYINSSGNETWKNDFYVGAEGILFNIQYKNGKLYDVICYGC